MTTKHDTPKPSRRSTRQGATKDAATPAEIDERRRLVAVLLSMRETHQAIAERIGVSRSTVERDIATIRQAWREAAQVEIKEQVALELTSLNEVQRRLWREHLRHQPIDLRAVDRLLHIHDRIARMLGLDKPQRIEVTGVNSNVLIVQRDNETLLDEIEVFSRRLSALAESTDDVIDV